MNVVCVFTAKDPIQAHSVKSILEDQGLIATLDSDPSEGGYGAIPPAKRVMVREDDLEKAVHVLEEYGIIRSIT